PDGLAEYLRAHRIQAVVDATHPFAVGISASAAAACGRAGVRLLRLARPGWSDHRLAGTWRWVDDYPAAVAAARGGRVLLTTGRSTLGVFASVDAPFVLVRLVEPATVPLPAGWAVVTSRGPYTVSGEVALMREHRIEVLITKDSGGAMTEAKLVAADQLGVRVVVVRRPPPVLGAPSVDAVARAVRWVTSSVGL
ncbi:MAG TPA: precorrin-6A reductase, partial [Nakamurella sp.]